MAKEQLILEHCRYLSYAPISHSVVMESVSRMAPEYHLKRMVWDISEAEKFMPNSKERILTVFDEAGDEEELGEVLEFHFRVEAEGVVVVLLYPGEIPWTQEEKEQLEVLTDITFLYSARIRYEEMLRKSALTHFKTGLPNSAGYIAEAAKILRRGKLKTYNALYFNLRGFGTISRRYGETEGSNIIKRYADKVREFLLPEEILGHLGGDNFVALVKKDHMQEVILYLGDVRVMAYRNSIEMPVHISSRVGVYTIPNDVQTIGDIIGLPAVALGVSRNVTHESVVFVNEDMVNRVNWQKQLEQLFAPALRNEEFQVYYQPKVDSRTNELVGAEGLVRWFHEGKMISPGDFIPPLEREGGIGQLDMYVLRHVCADIRHWVEEGLEPVTVSVNFSRRDLADEELAMQIDEIIRTFGVDRKYIQIEVTETVDELEHGMMTKFLNNLWDMNISTAIDDFGSGYSSLSTLRNFRVSVLKIDRSFINNDTLSEKDEIILRDIINMARNLGIDVITEGVERQDQLDFVNKVGCYMIQGFYYDRPLPKAKFRERLLEKKY